MLAIGRRVHHDAFLGVKALFAHIGTLNKRHDGQIKVACKGIVARVMGRHGHNGTCAIASQHIVAHPHRYFVARKGVDGISARKHTRHTAVGNALTLCTLFGRIKIGIHLSLLRFGGELLHEFALRSQHHEGYAKNSVGTCGKDSELHIAVLHRELHFGTLATTNPVALCLLERVCPVYFIKAIEQALCVCRHTQAPLLHFLLHHRVAAAFAHAVHIAHGIDLEWNGDIAA